MYTVLSSLNIKIDISDPVKPSPKPSWKKATQEDKQNYQESLEHHLSLISVPQSVTLCKDVKCRNQEHCQDVDKLATEVLEAVQVAADMSLPCPGLGKGGGNGQGKDAIPGWKETVKPFRDNAYFWHQVWVSCGRPMNTEVHTIMKRTRNIYHYQFRKCQKVEEVIRKNKLLEACLSNSGEDIFKEIKSMRNTRQVVATSVDGVKEDVPDHFRNIYSKLYNSVDDAENMAKVSSEVESKVNRWSICDVEKVTPDIIRTATKKLKPGKSDPVYSFSSDCIKVESNLLAELLSIIIKCYLVHGHVTRFLLLAKLVPIM